MTPDGNGLARRAVLRMRFVAHLVLSVRAGWKCYAPAVSASDDAAIAFLAPHCDLVSRLDVIPPSACIRGVFIRAVANQMEKRGRLSDFKRYFPNDRFSALPYYPLGDYLTRIACAGALIASPDRVHEGIHELSRGNSTAFAESLLGRAMLRLLARDPVRLSEQGLAGRRQTVTYGQWEIVHHGERAIEMVYRDEYCWIESVCAGGAQGTFESCGLNPKLETKLTDRFNGSTYITW
jgi:uncharacterized protein (TIGR02265 family)